MSGHRPSSWPLRAVLGLTLTALGLFLYAPFAPGQTERNARNRALAAALDLTDPALFSEARYTRHRSQADLHSAFQDGPGLPEHFPAGSWVPPIVSLP